MTRLADLSGLWTKRGLVPYIQKFLGPAKLILLGATAVLMISVLVQIDFVQLANLKTHWALVPLFIGPAIAIRFWLAKAWLLGFEKAKRPAFPQGNWSFAKGWIARYFPMRGLSQASRFTDDLGNGISALSKFVSIGVEFSLQLGLSLGIGAVLLYLKPIAEIPLIVKFSIPLLAIVALLTGIPKFWVWTYRKVIGSWFPQPKENLSATPELAIWKLGVHQFGIIIASGINLALLATSSISSLGTSDFLTLFFAIVTSNAVSMILPVLPAGLLIKDTALVFLLGQNMALELALGVALVFRIWAIAMDSFYAALSFSIRRL